jgi:predicted Zn-dependent protease
MKTDEKGVTHVTIVVTGVVLNSSDNHDFSINDIANQLVSQIQDAFTGQIDDENIDVNVTAIIRPIENMDEIGKTDHLFEVVNADVIPDNRGQADFYGKHVFISSNALYSMFPSKDKGNMVFDKKTAGHELGHTGGLIHPSEKWYNLLFSDLNMKKQWLNSDEAKTSNVMNPESGYSSEQTVTQTQIRILYDNFINNKLNQNNIEQGKVKQRLDKRK